MKFHNSVTKCYRNVILCSWLQNYSPHWHSLYSVALQPEISNEFGGTVSFNLHSITTTLRCKLFFVKQKLNNNNNATILLIKNRLDNISSLLSKVWIRFHPFFPKFVQPPFCTAIFKLDQGISAGLRSGLQLDHSRTFKWFFLNRWSCASAGCSG